MIFRAQPSILVLLELHRICPEVFDRLHIYIDGGFERGSDILKAISLGATAVGVGRPYLYSLTYGEEGVQHLTQGQFFYINLLPQERMPLIG
jgi:L-lactate dehydrogenase (cytochrome)